MQPSELRAESFSGYPPEARTLATKNLGVLRQIPLALLPVILRQLIDYDWRFPMERQELVSTFNYLSALQSASLNDLVASFAALHLPPHLVQLDWLNNPKHFTEALSAALWSLHLIDAYHVATERYQRQLQENTTQPVPAIPRLTLVVIGRGSDRSKFEVFQKLRPHGTLFTNLDPSEGMRTLFDVVATRAKMHSVPYAHWYIDGDVPDKACKRNDGITITSFGQLAPAATREMKLMKRFAKESTSNVGSRAVSSYMGTIRPEDLALPDNDGDQVLQRFEVSLLTEGSGTQVFSTTFVQWASRQCLQRAQPITLLARFAQRQQVAPMDVLLSRDPMTQTLDPEGSLVDADMSAYYTWINQARLPGAETAQFLAWFEGHRTAIAVTPALPTNVSSDSSTDMHKIMQLFGEA
jgi:hypothetical protein